MGLLRTTIKDAGDYFIKIVSRLPKKGNYGVLYIDKKEEEETISSFNLYQPEGEYKEIKIKEKLTGYTVDTLPSGEIGDRAYVTDATAPTYLQTLTGGGVIACPVFFNGTDWVSA